VNVIQMHRICIYFYVKHLELNLQRVRGLEIRTSVMEKLLVDEFYGLG
jgi:hypothetical protein